jgi:UDP-glucose 4-epimerase
VQVPQGPADFVDSWGASVNVLITGGAGLIGSFIAERLLARGSRVTILDNESTGKRENVPREAAYCVGDVRNLDDLRSATASGVDYIFHMAAQVSNILSYRDPSEDVSTNVLGTMNVIRLGYERGVRQMFQASSMALYGNPPALPVSEKTPVAPASFYGISKLAAENYMLAWASRKDVEKPIPVTALRMFNVYGPRQSLANPYQGVISVFIANLLKGEPITLYGDGEQTRDFVYIDDVVAAWLAALDNPRAYNRFINIGSGTQISINAMLDAVLAAFGHTRQSYPILHRGELSGDQRAIEADVRLAEELLQWKPRMAFQEGLARTISWARQQTF